MKGFYLFDLNIIKAFYEEMMNAKTVKHEIPKDLLGIGVRIEDDIVCTTNGPMNLTENAPKTIEEIEAVTA